MTPEELLHGDLELAGRIAGSSNGTFVGHVGEVKVVYKPVRGERPLWDFPDGTLAAREYASHLVSEATGWGIVPTTVLREGPFGPGAVQWWREPTGPDTVDVVPAGEVPDGWVGVFDALDQHERPLTVVHRRIPELRRIALLDVVLNNSDRKGGHVLSMAGGHVHGIDHGLTFHVDPKLRTVLWGWAGEPLADDERAALERLADQLQGDLGARLADLLTPHETEVASERLHALLAEGTFPGPEGGWPAVPWPPF